MGEAHLCRTSHNVVRVEPGTAADLDCPASVFAAIMCFRTYRVPSPSSWLRTQNPAQEILGMTVATRIGQGEIAGDKNQKSVGPADAAMADQLHKEPVAEISTPGAARPADGRCFGCRAAFHWNYGFPDRGGNSCSCTWSELSRSRSRAMSSARGRSTPSLAETPRVRRCSLA